MYRDDTGSEGSVFVSVEFAGGTEGDFRREVFECVKEDLRERFVMFGFTKAKVGE